MVETENAVKVGDVFRPRYMVNVWTVTEVAQGSVTAVDDEGNSRMFATFEVARHAGQAAYGDIKVGERFRPAYSTKLWTATAVEGDYVNAVDDKGDVKTFHKAAIPSL